MTSMVEREQETLLSRREEILDELRALRARQKELRAQLHPVSRIERAQRNEAIIAAIREGSPKMQMAELFNISRWTVQKITTEHERKTGERLPRLGRGRPHGQMDPARDQAIIAAYHELGTLQKAGERFGLSCERVRQIVVRDERTNGTPKVRHNVMPLGEDNSHYIPRVEWHCAGCGEKRMVVPALVNASERCRKCARKILTDDLIERAIATDRKRGAWRRIALDAGYQSNSTWQLERAVFTKLRSEGRDADVERIWPDGIPHWLRKHERSGRRSNVSDG